MGAKFVGPHTLFLHPSSIENFDKLEYRLVNFKNKRFTPTRRGKLGSVRKESGDIVIIHNKSMSIYDKHLDKNTENIKIIQVETIGNTLYSAEIKQSNNTKRYALLGMGGIPIYGDELYKRIIQVDNSVLIHRANYDCFTESIENLEAISIKNFRQHELDKYRIATV